MKKLISCEFNIDTGNVECRFSADSKLSIICEVVEDSIETIASPKVRSELDWLVYEAPMDYVRLVLTNKLTDYLKTVCTSKDFTD